MSYDSRKIIEDIIGKSVKIMSYPHGSVNKVVRDAVYSLVMNLKLVVALVIT